MRAHQETRRRKTPLSGLSSVEERSQSGTSFPERGTSLEDYVTPHEVSSILNDNKLDFMFIDGDHTYEGVRKDFEMYAPLVRKNGLIALHDIVEHPPEAGCDVNRFWCEVRTKYEYEEIVEDLDQKWAGIGLLKA